MVSWFQVCWGSVILPQPRHMTVQSSIIAEAAAGGWFSIRLTANILCFNTSLMHTQHTYFKATISPAFCCNILKYSSLHAFNQSHSVVYWWSEKQRPNYAHETKTNYWCDVSTAEGLQVKVKSWGQMSHLIRDIFREIAYWCGHISNLIVFMWLDAPHTGYFVHPWEIQTGNQNLVKWRCNIRSK